VKGAILNRLGEEPGVVDDLPAPTPQGDEVLVRVQASSVNPVDNAIVGGMLEGMVPHEFPITLGRDYAGVVEEVGSDAAGVSAGDEVFGFVPAMVPKVHAGSWAELIPVSGSTLAAKPSEVETALAGVAPLAAITAMTGVDALELAEGDAVLIVGAAGGVGSFAVQLAAAAGATVIAPALPEDEDYLRDLGATEIVPRDGDVVAAVRDHHPDGVDALFDLVSYEPGGFDGALKHRARVASSNSAAGEGPGRTNIMAAPEPDRLRSLAQMLAAGELKVSIQKTYGLDQAAEALRAVSVEHTRGKIALRVG
jgi:NADPH:quinone reductase-like Zn-dependent oxidoreductase